MQPSRQNPHSASKGSRPMRRTPSGLIVPMHAKLRGELRWQVLDERGVPEIPRDPFGRPIATAEGVRQHNLITNDGLDRLAAISCLSNSTTGFRGRLAVGTGSVAPAFTDTALDNEVQRDNDTGGIASTTLSETDTTNDVWRRSFTTTRVVTMSADRNLTEFGLSEYDSAGGGPLNIRELFRDGVGDPITISLLNGKKIRVDHTFMVELPRPADFYVGTMGIEEYDAGNNLVLDTTFDTYWTPASGGAEAAQWLADWWNPQAAAGTVNGLGTLIPSFDLDTSWSLSTYRVGGAGGDTGTALANQAYVPGSHERLRRATIPTSNDNGTWVGVLFYTSGTGGRNGTMAVNFDNSDSFVKDDTKTVRVGMLSSWSRA
jgi:hypothetical protein